MVSAGRELATLCVECRRWVHKRCSGISGKLKSNQYSICGKTKGGSAMYF